MRKNTGDPSSGFAAQGPDTGSVFGALHELEALASSENFFNWIVDEFGDAVGPNTLEVGAGLGTVSLALTRRRGGVVLALEPAANVYPRLVERLKGAANITPRHATSSDLVAEGTGATFDTAVYVNVLEHIDDDSAELDTGYRLLRPGGHLCVFVPAMPSLYARIDERSGHYRRYTKADLRQKVERAGFIVDKIEYMDVASIVPYWLVYRVLGVASLGSGSNTLFDRVLVPTSRMLQRVLRHPPIGKNLVLVAHRPT